MNINTIKVKWAENELSQNTHVVEFENFCIIIDAGCTINQIKQITNKPIKEVLVTHGHFDQIKIIKEYDSLNIPIYAHKAVLEMLFSKTNNVSLMFNQPETYRINNLHLLEDGDELKFADNQIDCLHTQGHSIDSMCYMLNNEILFSGDTVFSVAVGRDDLPTGNTKELIKSLNKILNLDYNLLYAGHGRPSNKQEQNQNIPKWIDYLSKKGEFNYE